MTTGPPVLWTRGLRSSSPWKPVRSLAVCLANHSFPARVRACKGGPPTNPQCRALQGANETRLVKHFPGNWGLVPSQFMMATWPYFSLPPPSLLPWSLPGEPAYKPCRRHRIDPGSCCLAPELRKGQQPQGQDGRPQEWAGEKGTHMICILICKAGLMFITKVKGGRG